MPEDRHDTAAAFNDPYLKLVQRDGHRASLSIMVDGSVQRLVVPVGGDSWQYALQFCVAHNIGDGNVCDRVYGATLARFDKVRQAGIGPPCHRRRLMIVAHPDDEVIWGGDTLGSSVAGDCWTVLSATGGADPEACATFMAVGAMLRARLKHRVGEGGGAVDVRMTMRAYHTHTWTACTVFPWSSR